VNSRWARRLAEVLLFVVIIGGIYAWRTRDLLPVGDRVAAPAFELTDLQGRPWSLDALEGKASQGASSDVYDAALERRVVAFQKSRALTPDGLVGDETLLQLTLATREPGVPSLSPRVP
jgi:hypothetical protein